MSATRPRPGAANPNEVGSDPAVAALLGQRGISEVLHFTTGPYGIVGICASGAVLSRDRLDENKYVEHIYTPNCSNRLKDADWTDYVNLSISRVNKWMLDRSERWHPRDDGIWWTVLSFDPVILTHPGVHFSTTNNTYTDTVRRATGVEGLEDMFSGAVPWGYYGCVSTRRGDLPASWTTNEQAEVLYPRQVPLSYLRAIYVAEDDHIDDIKTWIEMFSKVPDVPVTHRPEVFA